MANCELSPIDKREAEERVTASANGATAIFEWDGHVWSLVEKTGKYIAPEADNHWGAQPQVVFERSTTNIKRLIANGNGVVQPIEPGKTYIDGIPVAMYRGETVHEAKKRLTSLS